MDVRFRSREMHKVCCDHTALKGRWGAHAVTALTRTLNELEALERLGDLELLPYISIQRRGDGVVVLESSDGVRLQLTAHSSGPASARSWKTCDAVVILAIEVEDRT